MAEDSKCEQIVQYWVDKFEADDDVRVRYFKQVKRIRVKLADIKNFSSKQLPLLAIVAGLPKPESHMKGRVSGGGDYFKTKLKVEFIVFGMDAVNPSATILNIADDLWVTLQGDQLSGSGDTALTTEIDVVPEDIVYVVDPYFAFKMICTFTYYHTIGGI